MSDPRTIAVYDARVDDYVETVAREGHDPTLDAFIAAMPTGARVLDLGCAVANASAAMRDAGLVVMAVDPSRHMAAKAKALHDIDVTLGSFDDIPQLGQFDGIWANFSLLHATRDAMPRHLRDIRAALKPGGLFHIALKLGHGAARDSIDRFYTYYAEDEVAELLTAAGFRITETSHGGGRGLDGALSKWIVIHANA